MVLKVRTYHLATYRKHLLTPGLEKTSQRMAEKYLPLKRFYK